MLKNLFQFTNFHKPFAQLPTRDGQSAGEVSLATVLGQILQISTRFEIEVQPEFNLLQNHDDGRRRRSAT